MRSVKREEIGVKAQSRIKKKIHLFISEQQAGYLFIPSGYSIISRKSFIYHFDKLSWKTIFTLFVYFRSPNTEERTRGCLKTILSRKSVLRSPK